MQPGWRAIFLAFTSSGNCCFPAFSQGMDPFSFVLLVFLHSSGLEDHDVESGTSYAKWKFNLNCFCLDPLFPFGSFIFFKQSWVPVEMIGFKIQEWDIKTDLSFDVGLLVTSGWVWWTNEPLHNETLLHGSSWRKGEPQQQNRLLMFC